jgi:hypothetical protein
MHKYLVLLSFITLTAQAGSKITLGEYRLGNCDVTVQKDSFRDSEVEIRVDHRNDSSAGILNIDLKTNKIVRISSCNDLMSGSKYSILSTVEEKNGSKLLKSNCGGRWEAVDARAELSINSQSGKLTAFNYDLKVARFGLPNGMNSGPIKETMDKFSCN